MASQSLGLLSGSSRGERKKAFLEELSSPKGKLKYKRYAGAPIRYAGGKSLATGLIVELIPEDVHRIVSPFLGGGSVEVACAIELGLEVIGYDVFSELIAYWDVQINEPEMLYRRLLDFEPTRDTFRQVKERLNRHWRSDDKLSGVDLAAYFYFNHNMSYGPHFLGWPSDVYLNPRRYPRMLERVRGFRADGMQVGCASFEDVVPLHRDDFLYCDPPYYLGDDSKMFIGMYPHRNFPVYHNGFRHDLLRDMLMEHKGGFVLSYNDCETVREWYKGFNMMAPTWQYTFGQGDTRIGENRLHNKGNHVKRSHELLIWKSP